MSERKGFPEDLEAFARFRKRVTDDKLFNYSYAEGFSIPLTEAHPWPYPVVVTEGSTARELPLNATETTETEN